MYNLRWRMGENTKGVPHLYCFIVIFWLNWLNTLIKVFSSFYTFLFHNTMGSDLQQHLSLALGQVPSSSKFHQAVVVFHISTKSVFTNKCFELIIINHTMALHVRDGLNAGMFMMWQRSEGESGKCLLIIKWFQLHSRSGYLWLLLLLWPLQTGLFCCIICPGSLFVNLHPADFRHQTWKKTS